MLSHWCRPKDEFSKGKEWRLYDYVTRHFIASLMDDAEYDETPDSLIHAYSCYPKPRASSRESQ